MPLCEALSYARTSPQMTGGCGKPTVFPYMWERNVTNITKEKPRTPFRSSWQLFHYLSILQQVVQENCNPITYYLGASH